MDFVKTPLTHDIEIDSIITLHYFRYAKDFLFSGEKHDFWELAYVDKGEVGVMADNNGYVLKQGEAIFHEPNEYHNIWANGMYANVIIITFSCKSTDISFFRHKILKVGPEHREWLTRIFQAASQTFAGPFDILDQKQLILQADHPFGGQQLIKNYLEILLIQLVQANQQVDKEKRLSPESKTQNEQKIIDTVIDMMENNLYNHLTFDDIAEKICFSKSYLTKLFRAKVNKGIMEYFLDLKIDEAKKLISEKELSYTQIAEKLSFGSIHYFSKIFKIKTGMSPREYDRSVSSTLLI